jgi:hypothetical protein
MDTYHFYRLSLKEISPTHFGGKLCPCVNRLRDPNPNVFDLGQSIIELLIT